MFIYLRVIKGFSYFQDLFDDIVEAEVSQVRNGVIDLQNDLTETA